MITHYDRIRSLPLESGWVVVRRGKVHNLHAGTDPAILAAHGIVPAVLDAKPTPDGHTARSTWKADGGVQRQTLTFVRAATDIERLQAEIETIAREHPTFYANLEKIRSLIGEAGSLGATLPPAPTWAEVAGELRRIGTQAAVLLLLDGLATWKEIEMHCNNDPALAYTILAHVQAQQA